MMKCALRPLYSMNKEKTKKPESLGEGIRFARDMKKLSLREVEEA